MSAIRHASIVSGPERPHGHCEGHREELVLRLDGFAHQALVEESGQLGVPIRDLAVFAILYYLADLDSDRVARRIPPTPYPLAQPDG